MREIARRRGNFRGVCPRIGRLRDSYHGVYRLVGMGPACLKQPVLFMSWNDTHESVDEEISHRTKKRLSRDVQAGWSGVRNTNRKHNCDFCLCSESQRSRTEAHRRGVTRQLVKRRRKRTSGSIVPRHPWPTNSSTSYVFKEENPNGSSERNDSYSSEGL